MTRTVRPRRCDAYNAYIGVYDRCSGKKFTRVGKGLYTCDTCGKEKKGKESREHTRLVAPCGLCGEKFMRLVPTEYVKRYEARSAGWCRACEMSQRAARYLQSAIQLRVKAKKARAAQRRMIAKIGGGE